MLHPRPPVNLSIRLANLTQLPTGRLYLIHLKVCRYRLLLPSTLSTVKQRLMEGERFTVKETLIAFYSSRV